MKIRIAIAACVLMLGSSVLHARALPTQMEIEALVREYYDRMEALDVPGMRAMSTNTFEILDRGYRYEWYPFEQQLIFGQKIGLKWKFVLQDFRTVITDDVVYTSFTTIRPGYKYDGIDALTFRHVDGKWLVDRFIHTRMVNGTDPHRVPGGQKPAEAPTQ